MLEVYLEFKLLRVRKDQNLLFTGKPQNSEAVSISKTMKLPGDK